MMFTFGKYKGQLLTDVAVSDPSYCSWVVKNMSTMPDIVNALKSLIDTDSIYLTFGKYRNRTLKSIRIEDPKYIQFLINSDWVKDNRPDMLKELSQA